MRFDNLLRPPPSTLLMPILVGMLCALPWNAPAVPAADGRAADLYLFGLVAPAPIGAASGVDQLRPADGDGSKETPPVWKENPPVVRIGHTAAYDLSRGRMLVFGGLDGENLTNKSWVFVQGPEPAWELLESEQPDPIDYTFGDSTRRPSPRTGQAMVLIEGQNRLLVMGGYGITGLRGDVWELDLGEASERWTRVDFDTELQSSPLPRPRSGHTAVYDPEHERVLVFGGRAGPLDFLDDVWELDLGVTPAKWVQLEVADTERPSARAGHTAVYDPNGKRMLVFGGLDEGLNLLNDTWELSLSGDSGTPEWQLISPLPTDELPPSRARHAAVFDYKHNRMLIYAGLASDHELDDLWELSLDRGAAWRPLRIAGDAPLGRMGSSAVIDDKHDRLLIFGGFRRGSDLNDTWSLPLGGRGTPKWTLVFPEKSEEAGARLGHAAAYDPVRDRMLVVGGVDDSGPKIDVWAVDMATDGEKGAPFGHAGKASRSRPPQMSWRQLHIRGEAPTARSGHTVTYDPDGDRLLLFGGLNLVYLDDLWELPLGVAPGQQRWTRLLPGGDHHPSPRGGHTAIYDTRRKRIVIFGGVGAGRRTSEVFALSLGNTMEWKYLDVEGEPPSGRSNHVAVYDSLYDRMVVWGGIPPDYENPSVAWELCFGGESEPGSGDPEPATWKRMPTRGPTPPWLFGPSAVFDPTGKRAIIFGGGVQDGYRFVFSNQVYELSLSDTSTWKLVQPEGDRPKTRAWHSAIYDPVRTRMVVYGGGRISGFWLYRADLWTLNWEAAETQELVDGDWPSGGSESRDRTEDFGDRGPALALAYPQPNPTSGEAIVVFTLPGYDVARIEILDVRGRRVHARDLGSLGPGTHTLRIAEQETFGAGVYLVRLSYGTRMVTGKLTVLR